MTSFNIDFSGQLKREFVYYDSGLDGMLCSSNPSSSIVNDFIPYHALLSGKLFTAENAKALFYSFDVSKIYNSFKSYEEFFSCLYNDYTWVKLAKKNTVGDYRCRPGQLILLSEHNIAIPLVTLVVNKEYVFNIDKGKPDYSKFFVVISKKFSESEEHSNVYKNFCKQYLDMASKYLDIIYTKDIFDFCYKCPPITPDHPKTIDEAKTMNKRITYNVIQSLVGKEFT